MNYINSWTLISNRMLHGPCGVDNPQAKCIVNGKCSKCFPKEYRERIDWAEDSYPLYARLDNGLVFECNRARFTNQYVVPYYPQLLLLFDCYINVNVINFIWSYLHQFFEDFHGYNGTQKPLKRPFD